MVKIFHNITIFILYIYDQIDVALVIIKYVVNSET